MDVHSFCFKIIRVSLCPGKITCVVSFIEKAFRSNTALVLVSQTSKVGTQGRRAMLIAHP